MSTDLVPYTKTADLIKQGRYFELWVRLSVTAKRAMRRRKVFIVRNNKVINPDERVL
jgi:hypothetical protein